MTDKTIRDELSAFPVTLSNGNRYELDLGESLKEATLSTENLTSEISFYGKLLGALEREKILAEATYRQWRAVMTRSVLAKDPKRAEWKCKADVEADGRFTDLKQRMANAESACAAIRVHTNALLVIAGRADMTSPLHPPHEARRHGA